ncbi:unnamed protein product [Camellia sinensis]
MLIKGDCLGFVTKLMERVEATFIKHFANSNQRKGLNILRPRAMRERHRVTFTLGFLFGCTIAFIFALVLVMHARNIVNYERKYQYMETMFPLYSVTLPDFFLADQLTSQVKCKDLEVWNSTFATMVGETIRTEKLLAKQIISTTHFISVLLQSPNGLVFFSSMFGKRKRRKASNSRFGFVRYDCQVATSVAIQKADGLWCGNKALRVKRAEYQKIPAEGQQKPRGLSRGDEGRVQNRWVQALKWTGKGDQKSYAEVLLSADARGRERVVIKAQAEGNGWRSESLIVQLSSFLAFKDFREEMICRGMTNVVAREEGGKL